MTALAKRAVACKGWRWLPGMLAQFTMGGTPDQAIRVDCDGWGDGNIGKDSARYIIDCEVDDEPIADLAPDLDDPATLGCLLALVREASGNAWANLEVHGGKWYARFAWGSTPFDTEAEALVAALEAAPQKDEQCAL